MLERARIALIGLSLLSLPMLSGCGLQPGTTMISFQGGKLAPPPMEASETARYALYASNSGNALYSIELKKGEDYGFRKASDGSIEAFARDKAIPLQNWLATGYYWKQLMK